MTVYEALSLMIGCGMLVATIFIAVFTDHCCHEARKIDLP
ncbi:putative holin-like toxin [Aneurinibacillus soli]|nr:putative holin-like toxin [Aneurinibacillus soli]